MGNPAFCYVYTCTLICQEPMKRSGLSSHSKGSQYDTTFRKWGQVTWFLWTTYRTLRFPSYLWCLIREIYESFFAQPYGKCGTRYMSGTFSFPEYLALGLLLPFTWPSKGKRWISVLLWSLRRWGECVTGSRKRDVWGWTITVLSSLPAFGGSSPFILWPPIPPRERGRLRRESKKERRLKRDTTEHTKRGKRPRKNSKRDFRGHSTFKKKAQPPTVFVPAFPWKLERLVGDQEIGNANLSAPLFLNTRHGQPNRLFKLGLNMSSREQASEQASSGSVLFLPSRQSYRFLPPCSRHSDKWNQGNKHWNRGGGTQRERQSHFSELPFSRFHLPQHTHSTLTTIRSPPVEDGNPLYTRVTTKIFIHIGVKLFLRPFSSSIISTVLHWNNYSPLVIYYYLKI